MCVYFLSTLSNKIRKFLIIYISTIDDSCTYLKCW